MSNLLCNHEYSVAQAYFKLLILLSENRLLNMIFTTNKCKKVTNYVATVVTITSYIFERVIRM